MLDGADSLVIIGDIEPVFSGASKCEAGVKAAMVCANEHSFSLSRAIGAVSIAAAALLVALACSSEANAGVIVSCVLPSVDGTYADGTYADGNQGTQPFAPSVPQKRGLLSLFCPGGGPISNTSAGSSTGTTFFPIAEAGRSSELPEPEPRGYVAGAVAPVVPLPPLFDFLRPPRASC